MTDESIFLQRFAALPSQPFPGPFTNGPTISPVSLVKVCVFMAAGGRLFCLAAVLLLLPPYNV